MISDTTKERLWIELCDCAKQDGYSIDDTYTNCNTKLKCVCDKHKHIFYRTSTNIRKMYGCPECNKTKTYFYPSTCLWNTRPEIAQLLKNKDDGYKYSYGSGQYVDFVCNQCGTIINRKINQISCNGFVCPNCSAGNSYPNRFMYHILKQCKIDFISEFQDEWTYGKKFDFYFTINNNQYFIEMDGVFHFSGIYHPIEEIQINDAFKNKIAKDNDVFLIRIDCNYKKVSARYEYIKQSIKSSILGDIIDLSVVDFDYCDVMAKSTKAQICSTYWNHGIQSLEELSSVTGFSKDLVSLSLYDAVKLNMINLTKEELKKIIHDNGYKIVSAKVREIKNSNTRNVKCDQTGEVFSSCAEAKRKYPTLTLIYDYLYGKTKNAGTINDVPVTFSYVS